jgi:dTDP-4-dehydrorhamnose 3,5-epimerase
MQKKQIKGVRVFEHESTADLRGFFKYAFRINDIPSNEDKNFLIRQVNHSYSAKGVLRGIHAEPWEKIVYIPSGRAEICIINLMRESDEFGHYMLLTCGDFEGGRKSVYVPIGFGNAFYCLEDTHYLNFVTEQFDTKSRSGCRWDEPQFKINWTHVEVPILSKVDENWPVFTKLPFLTPRHIS